LISQVRGLNKNVSLDTKTLMQIKFEPSKKQGRTDW